MEKTEIHAVEMTRRNRAEHAARLKNASPEERLRFYRDKAQRLGQEVAELRRSQSEEIGPVRGARSAERR